MIGKLIGQNKVLEKALNATMLRNEVISQNIANVDTPRYKRKTVSFEEQLGSALESRGFQGTRTDPRHRIIGSKSMEGVEPRVIQENHTTSLRLDGNNVDIENEMATMAQNTVKYNTLIQTLNGGFKRLKSVISEGRR